ncbi:MAG: hypothetical protein KBG28_26305 [Kofleriaceae bacterium]|jgi:hypothetical protein|nr:hypothetical protein [Kofleriaceae bacterium]MBP6837103.1 hypothetical protein [Kofleriaceae bacterium]MBP9207507.1 hypothetical protein [Kofleriaceae bacterium]
MPSRRAVLASSLVVLAALLVGGRATDAAACSISGDPSAHVFGSIRGAPLGRQPWIALWRTTGAVRVTRVAAACKAGRVCKGTPVAVDRTGNYLRPRAPLPPGARVQVVMGRRLLADVTVTTAATAAPPLPAWGGVRWSRAAVEAEGICSPAGPVVDLVVDPKQANLDGAALLVYLQEPVPGRPERGLARIMLLGPFAELRIGNDLGASPWLRALPARIWVALADSHGQVGPAIALSGARATP